MAQLHDLTMFVDVVISDFQKKGVEIPKDSMKNNYTRACWVLGRSQKVLLANELFHTHRSVEDKEIAIITEELRKSLPLLREKVKRG